MMLFLYMEGKLSYLQLYFQVEYSLQKDTEEVNTHPEV